MESRNESFTFKYTIDSVFQYAKNVFKKVITRNKAMVGQQNWTRCNDEKNKMSFISSFILHKLFLVVVKEI